VRGGRFPVSHDTISAFGSLGISNCQFRAAYPSSAATPEEVLTGGEREVGAKCGPNVGGGYREMLNWQITHWELRDVRGGGGTEALKAS